ncbi:hypothetical protein E4U19_007961 [Claviceps sp. Clav32 group G5]|nr:hypothetical protein E4U19_007961 [Claviceps sp. Clav32 group G5]
MYLLKIRKLWVPSWEWNQEHKRCIILQPETEVYSSVSKDFMSEIEANTVQEPAGVRVPILAHLDFAFALI